MPQNDAKRTLDQAQADLEALLDELAAEGFSTNGWDDGNIYLASHRPEDTKDWSPVRRQNERQIAPREAEKP